MASEGLTVKIGAEDKASAPAGDVAEHAAIVAVRVALHALKVEMRQIPRLRVETACIGIFERMTFDDEHLLRTISGVQALIVLLTNHSFGVPDAEARVCNAVIDAMDALLALADIRDGATTRGIDGNPGSHPEGYSPDEIVRALVRVQDRVRDGRTWGVAVVELRAPGEYLGVHTCFLRAPSLHIDALKRALIHHGEHMKSEPSPSESGTG